MAKSKKQISLATPANLKREFTRVFREFSGRLDSFRYFRDLVEMGALAFSNRCDLRNYEEREKRYLEIIKSYDRDEDRHRFPELIALAALSFDKHGPHDFFGEIFGANHLDLGNSHMGQIFTPFAISSMMATMTLQDCKPLIEKHGFITMLEPASGSGGMVAAAAEAVSDLGFDYREVLHVTAVDLDLRCTHMTYLTCCMLDIPAVVHNGDSLGSDPMRSTWVTPRHVFGGWRAKLHAQRHSEMLAETPLWQALQVAE